MYRYHAFMAQITDKMAQDAHIYGYSMEEAYKFFYGTAIKTAPPPRETASRTFVTWRTIPNTRASTTIPCTCKAGWISVRSR